MFSARRAQLTATVAAVALAVACMAAGSAVAKGNSSLISLNGASPSVKILSGGKQVLNLSLGALVEVRLDGTVIKAVDEPRGSWTTPACTTAGTVRTCETQFTSDSSFLVRRDPNDDVADPELVVYEFLLRVIDDLAAPGTPTVEYTLQMRHWPFLASRNRLRHFITIGGPAAQRVEVTHPPTVIVDDSNSANLVVSSTTNDNGSLTLGYTFPFFHALYLDPTTITVAPKSS
ncbi:MAG: hypothetical protein ICV64_05690 [Thermoleophilia bacterium]|nr:hypothetical protein [Thermoleophilia bacterium]